MKDESAKMPDRERVRRQFEEFAAITEPGMPQCVTISAETVRDVLAILKEQEAPIRCAECRYYEKRCPSEDIGWCNRPGAGCGQPEEFWCAGAERKEDGGGE